MRAVYRNTEQPPIPWISEGFFDFWSSRVHPLWTLRRPLARIISRSRQSVDAVTLVLQPNRHFAGVRPGQHITLGAEIDGRLVSRSYSPTVLPRGRLAVTIKAVAGGRLSQHLGHELAVGGVLDIGTAFGTMTVDAADRTPLLMLAAGSGITPMRALLQQLDDAGMPMAVDLVYWARHAEELCFAQWLQALAARHANFRVHVALTRDAGAPAQRVGEYALEAIADLAAVRVLACGPGGFVDAARARLEGGVARFEAEAFTAPVLPDVESGQVQVQLLRSGRTLSIDRGIPLLQALEAQGIHPPSGCRMGICNTCVCGKVSGITRQTLTGDYAAEPSTPLKLCVNSASTDLTLEL